MPKTKLTHQTIDRRMKQVHDHAIKRADAALWRGMKHVETEIAALMATRTELLRLRSLKRPR